MISRLDLRRIAKARVADSEVLFRQRRYDGALYLCGYAVEIGLKARICQTLKWMGYPETRGEFQELQSFKVHNLDILLRLSGVEQRIKTRHMVDWSIVGSWAPEARYKPVGSATRNEAKDMIEATRNLLRVL